MGGGLLEVGDRVSTWVLSIDTTAALLAPIGLAMAAELGLSAPPFAFASILLANSASLLLWLAVAVVVLIGPAIVLGVPA